MRREIFASPINTLRCGVKGDLQPLATLLQQIVPHIEGLVVFQSPCLTTRYVTHVSPRPSQCLTPALVSQFEGWAALDKYVLTVLAPTFELTSYSGTQSRASSNGRSTSLRSGMRRMSISRFCIVVSARATWSVPVLPAAKFLELTPLAAYDALRLGRSRLSSSRWS